MRTPKYLMALGAMLGSSLALHACGTAVHDLYDPLTAPTSGSDGGTDGGGPDCSGDPSVTNVVDACGVFAQADAPAGGDGTMATPFAKLGDAVSAAQTVGKRVYACTSAPFTGAVTISAGIEVYGGFDCTKGWVWSQDARAVLDGPADTVAVTVTSAASRVKIEGFAITAASPSSMTMGGSSIAVAVADVTATLDHCDVTARDAAAGADGTTPTGKATKGADAATMGATGTPTDACNLPAGVTAGAPGSTTCGGVDTSGGVGGKGGITGTSNGNGADGTDGAPVGNVDHGTGANASSDCADATKGKVGTAGNAGSGGSLTSDALSLSGIANGDDTNGHPGTPGQGGGGGGGAKSGMFCPPTATPIDGPGASGGGGGAGGCGGLGGGGGKAGGSSVAIVSLGTKLTLTAVTLSVGKGGKGGDGVLGQGGGAFGVGAVGGGASGLSGSKAGCQGGSGGAGGDGGPGGGGRGGHAIGIAYAMAPATMLALQMFTPGTPGAGGTAGNGAPSSSNGTLGNAGQCWDFGANLACK